MKKRILRMVAAAGLAAVLGAVVASPPAEATPTPWTTPNVTRVWGGRDASTTDCSTGYLCAFVWYDHSGWYEFKFYHCRVYDLHYWHDPVPDRDLGFSFVYDYQTGGVTTTLYGKSGNVLQRIRPKIYRAQDVLPGKGGWDPVWAIRVC